ncbi:hypothetical protein [Litorimonas sp. WD9-15]
MADAFAKPFYFPVSGKGIGHAGSPPFTGHTHYSAVTQMGSERWRVS